jgi:hypothetical protein
MFARAVGFQRQYILSNLPRFSPLATGRNPANIRVRLRAVLLEQLTAHADCALDRLALPKSNGPMVTCHTLCDLPHEFA